MIGAPGTVAALAPTVGAHDGDFHARSELPPTIPRTSAMIERRWEDRSIWTVTLVSALGYFGLAYLGNESGLLFFDKLTLFWPSAGFALGAVLYLGNRAAPGIALGAFLAEVYDFFDPSALATSLGVDAVVAIASTLEAIVGAAFLRSRCGGRSPLGRPQDVMILLSVAILTPLVSAGLAAPLLGWASFYDLRDIVEFGATWWLGETTGILVVTPLMIAWLQTNGATRGTWPEALLWLGATLFVAQIVFGIFGGPAQRLPLAHLFIPIFVWAILRFGMRGATLSTFLVYMIATIATPRGAGPFVTDSPLLSVLMVQLFLATFALGSLTLSSMLAEQETVENALHAAKRELVERVALRTGELSTANAQLLTERNFSATVIDLAGTLVMVLDTAGNVVKFNRACEQLTGRTYLSVVGSRAWEAFPPPLARAGFTMEIDRVLGGGRSTGFEGPWLDARGKERVLAWSEATLEGGDDDCPAFVILSGLDVTDRKRSEEALARGLAIEREARIEAQKSVQLRDDFISIASHELRTPLTPLKINAEVLRIQIDRFAEGTPKAATLRRVVDNVQREVERLLGLIESLLDVSRVAGGRLVLKGDRFDLAELVREIGERFRPQLERARCELTIDAPRRVLGEWDRARLEQVVTNLLTNAMKYASGKPIEISVEARDRTAALVVRDHGMGIRREDRDRIFDRFERAAPIQSFGGLGLGLYITHGIVVAHGGTIDVESTVGEGSTFRVVLPLQAQATEVVHGESQPVHG